MYKFYFNSKYTFLGVAYNVLMLITFYSGPNKKYLVAAFEKQLINVFKFQNMCFSLTLIESVTIT